MLALQSAVNDDHRRGDPTDVCTGDDNGFPDFSDAHALLDGIDFDDLFLGMDDADPLPDLESMDPELLADFSVASGEESSDVNTSLPPDKDNNNNNPPKDEIPGSDEIASKRDGSSASGKNRNNSNNSSPKDGLEKSRKSSCSSSQSKNSSHGKRKVKVDWTPELHRRFVQAVEQLGVDKAVPSRILELMGIDCLTRHNIASHLQKYRSHRKHLLAREVEAASWTQRRQMYGGAAAGCKRAEVNPWVPTRPTLGFPPTPPPMHAFRPLHVWGHPTVDPSATHMWPKHPPLPPEPPFWHHQRAANAPGTPCFPPPMRFVAPPVPGIPPHAMYKLDPDTGAAARSGPPPSPLFDIQPSKESIDAAIGDVLSKPWLPLPLGLNPPSTDSVMGQLQRQGVPKVPPATTCV